MTYSKRSWGILGSLVAFLILVLTLQFTLYRLNTDMTYDAEGYTLIAPDGKGPWILPPGTKIILPKSVAHDTTDVPREVTPRVERDTTMNSIWI